MHAIRWLVAGAIAGAASSSSAFETALSPAVPPIDLQLEGQLDFRDVRFRQCFEKPRCTVGGATISAYRRASSDSEWVPAKIYWDPIDGLGVLDGGQDDEIDFNERVVVELGIARNFSGVWLTDLFTQEKLRYEPQAGITAASPADEDREDAIVRVYRGGHLIENLLVSGNQSLPHQSFNHFLDPSVFNNGGDLRRRLIIADGEAHLMLADRDGANLVQVRHIPLGHLDPEKRNLLGPGLNAARTAELLALYTTELEVDLSIDSSANAWRVSEILDEPIRLTQMNADARVRRQLSDRSNGEVSAELEHPILADTFEFTSSLRTSNDFSVAGIFFRSTPR